MTGSSPPARGTLDRERPDLVVHRFIPACAGNTSPRPIPSRRDPVHPRLRGEHLSMVDGVHVIAGSSPRARGTQLDGRAAGASTPVHPRGRGEHATPRHRSRFVVRFIPARAGNTLTGREATGHRHRFIPARAGNTSSPHRTRGTAPVHPRGRGEHFHKRDRDRHRDRFIPAGAGNTMQCAFRTQVSCRGSSPRARGTQARGISRR